MKTLVLRILVNTFGLLVVSTLTTVIHFTHTKPVSNCSTFSSVFCPSGIPFICFLLFLPLSVPWADVNEWWIGVVHYLACLSPTVFSVFYHLFMNHEGGAPTYDILLSFDMFGICLVNTLGKLWNLGLYRVYCYIHFIDEPIKNMIPYTDVFMQ